MSASSVHKFEGRVFEELSGEIFGRCHVRILEYPDDMTRCAKKERLIACSHYSLKPCWRGSVRFACTV